jgi:hypothetical protein
MSFTFGVNPGITGTSVPFTPPIIANASPRSTATHDACCFSDFYGVLLNTDIDMTATNIIALFISKIIPDMNPLVKYEQLFDRIFRLFTDPSTGVNTIINYDKYNEFMTKLVTTPIDFWREFTKTGGSYFSTILTNKIDTRSKLSEVTLYNTANAPETQCQDILDELHAGSRCQYCGILAGISSVYIYRLTCEHLLEAVPLFCTIGLSPNKNYYNDTVYAAVRNYLRACGCYTYACHHCNQIKMNVQTKLAGVFVGISTAGIFARNDEAIRQYALNYFTTSNFTRINGGVLNPNWVTNQANHIKGLILTRLDHYTSIHGYPLVIDKVHRYETPPKNPSSRSTYRKWYDGLPDQVTFNSREEVVGMLDEYYSLASVGGKITRYEGYVLGLVVVLQNTQPLIDNVTGLVDNLIAYLNGLLIHYGGDMTMLLTFGITKLFSRLYAYNGKCTVRSFTGGNINNIIKYNLKGGGPEDDPRILDGRVRTAIIMCGNDYINEVLFGDNEVCGEAPQTLINMIDTYMYRCLNDNPDSSLELYQMIKQDVGSYDGINDKCINQTIIERIQIFLPIYKPVYDLLQSIITTNENISPEDLYKQAIEILSAYNPPREIIYELHRQVILYTEEQKENYRQKYIQLEIEYSRVQKALHTLEPQKQEQATAYTIQLHEEANRTADMVEKLNRQIEQLKLQPRGGKKRKNKRKTKRRKQKKHLKRKTRK